MSKKSIISIICALVLSFPLFGCWDRIEPKSFAVVTSAIYDYVDGHFETTFEILKPSSGGGKSDSGSTESKNYIFSQVGATLSDSVKDFAISIENKVFGGNNKVRIFTESFAKEHMYTAIDFFLRDRINDELPYVLIFNGEKVKDIYEADIGISQMTGIYLETLLKNQLKELSTAPLVTTLDFVKTLIDDGINPVAAVLSIKEEKAEVENAEKAEPTSESKKPKKILVIEGLAAFKKDKLVGFLDGEEAKAFNILTNKAQEMFVNIKETDNQFLSTELKNPKCNISAKIEDGKAKLKAEVKINPILIQRDPYFVGLTNKEIGDLISAKMKANMKKTIEHAKELKTDIFGFSKSLFSSDYKQWLNVEKTWDDDIFPSAEIEINIKCEINETLRNDIYRKGGAVKND